MYWGSVINMLEYTITREVVLRYPSGELVQGCEGGSLRSHLVGEIQINVQIEWEDVDPGQPATRDQPFEPPSIDQIRAFIAKPLTLTGDAQTDNATVELTEERCEVFLTTQELFEVEEFILDNLSELEVG